MEITKTTILKPPTTTTTNSNSKVPLTIFDRAAFDLHVAVLYAFRPPMPSNSTLISALSTTLLHFPHLAGTLSIDPTNHNLPCIHLNNAGALLVETHLPITLSNQLPLLDRPSPDLVRLHPSTQGNVPHLLQIQLNRYACGGLVIGQTAHHHVADGQSMSAFYRIWAELARGARAPTPPLPFHGRASVSVPRDPPRVAFNHLEIEFKNEKPKPPRARTIESLSVHYTAEFVSALKTKAVERCSTFECLLAHTWKKITAARGLNAETTTRVRVAVNGRARMREPGVPMEYFGNLVLWAYPEMRVEELMKGGYARAVKAIHEAVACVDDAYFKSFVDFGDVVAKEEEVLVATVPEAGSALCPDLEVDSWLGFRFHELDFGSGGPCAFLPPELPVEGLLVFVPSCKEVGGVDVFLALEHDHGRRFRETYQCIDEFRSSM
ncbi:Agmatine coumaroyltransferase-2 [Acorus calamus]|uniref:Agmatine coumaroyltransferase-2 n=1 Tax=Acorus calamus TaxID=4465 RepID=A0AAV9FLQ0_ACOCL|nr:Agmatine coumaroyltransferase-2 [Acorus calamus]